MTYSRPTDDPLVPEPGARFSGHALGLDVGGTGVKGAIVDLETGELVTERLEEPTPHPATPDAVVEVVRRVAERLEATRGASGSGAPGGSERSMADAPADALPVGCGLPGVVKYGRLMTAANIDRGWLEVSAEELLTSSLGRPVLVLNDADAAGLAEMVFGAGVGHLGTVLLLTIGTGIGSALFIDGRLVPNTELGHLELNGTDAETLVSGTSRERRGLDWEPWAADFNAYLARVEAYLWPDLIILGGGVSRVLPTYERFLRSRARIVPAQLLNSAGIVGAAVAAANAEQAASGSRSGAATDVTPSSAAGTQPTGP